MIHCYKTRSRRESQKPLADCRLPTNNNNGNHADSLYRFLLAQLYLDSLEDKHTPNAIRRALEGFRKQNQVASGGDKTQVLVNAYERNMERVNRQKPGSKELAMKVFAWITCEMRPLSTLEL